MFKKIYTLLKNKNNCNFGYIFKLAMYFAEKTESESIIYLYRNKANKFFAKAFKMKYQEKTNSLENELKNAQLINFHDIDENLLRNAIVVINLNIASNIRYLSEIDRLSSICKYLIISSRKEKYCNKIISDIKWKENEYFTGKDKYENVLILSGSEIKIDNNLEQKKILAIMHIYNEEDFVENTIEHLLSEGLDLYIVDNWSTDSTYEILLNYEKKYNGRIVVEHFPTEPTKDYEWEKQLKRTEEIAETNKEYDWCLHYDADEIRISPWKGITLSQAISFIDHLGYNAIDFTVLDFRPTESEDDEKLNTVEKNKFFEFGKRPGHFSQVKGWKNQDGVKVCLSETGGHEAQFSNKKVFPLKFLTKHYPLRSSSQARKKIFIDRLPRFVKEKKEKGWHMQYDTFLKQDQFIFDKKFLIKWNENLFMSEFLIERISGIGILEDKGVR